DEHLRSGSFFGLLLNQRQQSVGRGAGDDFEHPALSQLSKRREQVAFPFVDKEAAARTKEFKVKLRKRRQLGLILISFSLTRGQIDQEIEMPDVTLAQKFVQQHRAERWREGHGKLERNVVVHQPLHHLQERDVSLGDRLEKPVFLEEMFVLWVANERQVRVKNEGELARHCRFQVANFRLKSESKIQN